MSTAVLFLKIHHFFPVEVGLEGLLFILFNIYEVNYRICRPTSGNLIIMMIITITIIITIRRIGIINCTDNMTVTSVTIPNILYYEIESVYSKIQILPYAL